MKKILLLITFLTFGFSWGQVTIASDGLNNSTTLFTLSGGAYYTGISANVDRPATSPFASEGTYSRGVSDDTATLTSSNINTTGYTSVTTSFKLASFSINSTGNGADGSDDVTVEVSPNGGTNWYSTVVVAGNSNAYWAYTSGTGNATTAYDGNATPVTFAPSGGGNKTADGYSNVEITGLPSVSNLRVRITLFNNSTSERWLVDDFKVEGVVATPAPEINLQGLSSTDIVSGDITPSNTDGTDFGSTNIAGGTVVRTFTIQNTGNALLSLTGASPYVSIGGVNAADFAVTAIPSNSIAASGSTTFQITFDPTTIGIKNATISIANNDTTGGEDPYTFAIRGTGIATPSIVLSSTSPAVPASTITQGANENVIYKFNLAVTAFDAILTNITFNTSGTYAASNITNFKAYYSTDATFSIATDTFLDNETASLGTGSHTFSGFSQTIPMGSTGTIFITADLPCTATNGNTIIVDAITTSNLTFTSGTKSGNAFVSGTHTFQNAIPVNVTGVTTAGCESGQVTINWTSPSVCYDNLLVYAVQGSFTSAIPTGNGSAYTPSTTFGSGTGFDGGYTVYKNTGNSVTITGLTNGETYSFKVFTRNGTVWSNGVEVSCTPILTYCTSSTPGATNTADSEIENVTLTGISNSISNNTTNICTLGVNDFTAMYADLQVGSSNTLTVEFGDCNGGTQFNGAGGVWIDWNNDGDFDDAGENIGLGLVNVSTGNVIRNFTINVPIAQALGFYRMRIVQKEGGTVANTTPCGSFSWGSIEDYTIEVINACIPTHTVSSFTPTSGPVGTEVTINGTGLTGATVSFSGINAVIVSSSPTQIIAIVPAGATTGKMIVLDSQPCGISNNYTVIKRDNTSCQGVSVSSDLILYEVHDEKTGSGGTVTLYNGTASTINLSTYRIYRAGDANTGTYSNYATLTGSIAAGALGIVRVAGTNCGSAATNGSINSGFNENDGIQLRGNNGLTIIDDVDAPSASAGYYMKRALGSYTTNPSYVAADWTIVSLAAGQCGVGLGTAPVTTGNNPNITAQPTYSPNCGSLVLVTTATEGFVGGFSLTYQWYVNIPGSTSWTALTNTGVYTGATSNSLSISSTSGLNDYQYYCQVREDSATCFTATNAVKIKDDFTTWNGTTWSYGAPTLARKAILNGNYVTATNGNFECCTLEVNATRILTVSVDGYVTIDNNLINNGDINVLNNGSIVQINETDTNTATGTNFKVNRITNVKHLDYVYWSSPVEGFNVSGLPNNNRYYWDPIAVNANGSEGNFIAASGNMVKGRGYIARISNAFPTTPQPTNVVLQGSKPHNGQFTYPISRGSTTGTDDTWNLIGNPYPSAIDATTFLTDNTTIEGSVRVWKHGIVPAIIGSPFYQNFQYNYSEDDYIIYNGTASIPAGLFEGKIASGQGFFIRMLEEDEIDGEEPTITTTSGSSTVTFKNSFRRTSGAILDNSQFFKSTSNQTTLEKSRIWLDLIASNNQISNTVVGYVEGATLAKDRMFDALIEVDAFKFYTLINTQKQAIQGRPLPFDSNDQVPMGIFIQAAGNYIIAISSVDGLFSEASQNIYLEDKLLNVIHDLRQAPYSFSSAVGEFNDRFVLRYTNTVLSNPTFENANNFVIVSNSQVSLSASESIKSVMVFDMLGRKIYEKNNINTTNVVLDKLIAEKQALIVKTTFENGTVIDKKIIY